MSSAQLDVFPREQPHSVDDTAAQLRQQVAERLAAHRSRRKLQSMPAEAQRRSAKPSNPIAATVAARYAQSPSYRAFLAEEARRAIEQANAAAEVAARNAEAVAAVQLQLLDELESERVPSAVQTEPRQAAPPKPVRPMSSAGVTVRLYEDVVRQPVETHKESAALSRAAVDDDIEESRALDEEIAFRQAPFFEVPEPPSAIPANLLEFPRQLVAPRKARPRLAEGPLREQSDFDPSATHASGQLRIFEVAPTLPPPAPEPAALPEWTSIWLDEPTDQPLEVDGATRPQTFIPVEAPAVAAAAPSANPAPAPAPQLAPMPSLVPIRAASLSHRALAATLDAALIFGGLLASVTGLVWATGPALQIVKGEDLALAAAAAFLAFYVLYHLLFFTFSDGTPGMRYARVDFCTFEDGNPTRAQLRRRLLATLVAACPLGLGLLWACLDDDRLGWHDRISRMYPRSY